MMFGSAFERPAPGTRGVGASLRSRPFYGQDLALDELNLWNGLARAERSPDLATAGGNEVPATASYFNCFP